MFATRPVQRNKLIRDVNFFRGHCGALSLRTRVPAVLDLLSKMSLRVVFAP